MELAALALSILALALAALTALKMRKLEFCPEIVAGDVILPRESRRGDRVRLAPSVAFLERRPRRRRDRVGGTACDAPIAGGLPGALLPGGRGRHAALHPRATRPQRGVHRALHRLRARRAAGGLQIHPVRRRRAGPRGTFLDRDGTPLLRALRQGEQRPSAEARAHVRARAGAKAPRRPPRRPRGLPHRLPGDAAQCAARARRLGVAAASEKSGNPDFQLRRLKGAATRSGPWHPSLGRRGTFRARTPPPSSPVARSASKRPG